LRRIKSDRLTRTAQSLLRKPVSDANPHASQAQEGLLRTMPGAVRAAVAVILPAAVVLSVTVVVVGSTKLAQAVLAVGKVT